MSSEEHHVHTLMEVILIFVLPVGFVCLYCFMVYQGYNLRVTRSRLAIAEMDLEKAALLRPKCNHRTRPKGETKPLLPKYLFPRPLPSPSSGDEEALGWHKFVPQEGPKELFLMPKKGAVVNTGTLPSKDIQPGVVQ